MPGAFMDYALKFIDSILPAPVSNAGLSDELSGTDVKWGFSPNPMDALGTVYVESITPKSITLSLLGIYGDENREIFRGELPGGLHKFPVDVTGFPSGVYFLRLHTERLSFTKKLVIK
jgi:hypothetical protein